MSRPTSLSILQECPSLELFQETTQTSQAPKLSQINIKQTPFQHKMDFKDWKVHYSPIFSSFLQELLISLSQDQNDIPSMEKIQSVFLVVYHAFLFYFSHQVEEKKYDLSFFVHWVAKDWFETINIFKQSSAYTKELDPVLVTTSKHFQAFVQMGLFFQYVHQLVTTKEKISIDTSSFDPIFREDFLRSAHLFVNYNWLQEFNRNADQIKIPLLASTKQYFM